MRWLIVALMLALTMTLTLGLTQGYALGGGNGAVNVTLFGTYRSPLPESLQGAAGNATRDVALTVDVGLAGAYNASYVLIDSKDREYELETSLTRELQPGRLLVGFVVPRDALFKLIKVIPNQGSSTPISVNWWKTPKTSNANVILRYYGILDQRLSTDEQIVAFEVGIQNNGTQPLVLSPENFTILDQNAWEYYTLDGFSTITLAPQKAVKVKVNFSQISPWSKPTILIYDYMTENMLGVNLERDTGPLSDEQVYGTSGAPESQPQEQAAVPQQIQEQAAVPQQSAAQAGEVSPMVVIKPKATSTITTPMGAIPSSEQEALMAKLDEARARIGTSTSLGLSGGSGTGTAGINSTVEDARARLAKVRTKLSDQQK